MVEPGKGNGGDHVLTPFGGHGEHLARSTDETSIEPVRSRLRPGDGRQIVIGQMGRQDGHMEKGRNDADDQVGRVERA